MTRSTAPAREWKDWGPEKKKDDQMSLRMNPEVAAAIELLARSEDANDLPIGDVDRRRSAIESRQRMEAATMPRPADVVVEDFWIPSRGASILVRWYAKAGSARGPGVVYIHGGGMILSSVELCDGQVSRYVSQSGVPFLSVDYRYAPEHPHPTPVEDCFTALSWIAAHSEMLEVDPSRIALMGASAGGGLAASTAMLARDRGGPAVSQQVLIYPMLDDRNVDADPELVPFATWTYEDNATGWGALLGAARGSSSVPCYAAAARVADLIGLPPAYLEVGDLDIFRDEVIEFARRLSLAGVSMEMHLHPGVPHGFDNLAPDCDVTRRSAADRLRVLRSL